MKQQLKQATVKKLAVTQHMVNSLSLLEMGPDELKRAAESEAKRNLFLKSIPIISICRASG